MAVLCCAAMHKLTYCLTFKNYDYGKLVFYILCD